MRPSTRLTVTAGFAAVLGTVPLGVMFANVTWLFPAATAVAMVTAFHVLARVLRLPAPLVPLAGTLGLLVFLCWAFARPAGFAGLLPTRHSFTLLGETLHHGLADVSTYAIPAPTTPGLVLLVTLAAGAAAVAMDAIAVGARRPATAGLVMLALYAVPTAVATSTLPWPYFVIGASGFLLLLLAEERDRLLRWGRPVSPTDPAWQGDPTPARSAGRRTGLVALAVAVLVPLLAPGLSASGLSGLGPGGSDGPGGNRLDPFATLRGLLLRGGTPYELVRLRSTDKDVYYLRTLVLDRYTDAGWGMSSPRGEVLPAGNLPVPELPDTRQLSDTRQLTAAVTTTRYQDRYLPTLDGTTRIDGLAPAQWRYDPSRAMVFSTSTTTAGQSYTLSVREPRPTVAALRQAPRLRPDDPTQLRWAEVPVDLPVRLTHLVHQLTDSQPTPYDKAQAVYNYFSPVNGFAYTTATKDGSSGSDLVNFALVQRQGYCQQYAAAMAIMLRAAGVPARVVLGFTHHGTPRNGTWSIMNTDAHAWVEAYFAGIGWVPFDPTPPDPTTPGRSQGLPWAPTLGSLSRPVPSGGSQPSDVPPPGRGNRTRPDTATDPALAGPAPARVTPTEVLAGLGVLLALLLASPGVARVAQRRSRLATAGRGGPRSAARAAWDELVATATDLDIALRPAESPRASAARLITEVPLSGPAAAALRLLALAEERARYARDPAVGGDLPTAVRAVLRGLGAARGRGRRWLARCAPPSVLRGLRESVAQGNDRVSRRLERFGLAVRRLVPRRRLP
jgi:transglutaminase-like putative cysteine protease